jgi:hypothetical protein
MKKAALGGLKFLSVAALLGAVALVVLPTAGCTQQNGQMQVSAEKERGSDVAAASDEPAAGETASTSETTRTEEKKRSKVTKHGPRPR